MYYFDEIFINVHDHDSESRAHILLTFCSKCAISSVNYQQMNAEYNHIVRKVAHNNNLILIDHEQWWHTTLDKTDSTLDKLLLPDGIHLSKKGHVLYAHCASSHIISTLKTHFESLKQTIIQYT